VGEGKGGDVGRERRGIGEKGREEEGIVGPPTFYYLPPPMIERHNQEPTERLVKTDWNLTDMKLL